MSDSEPCADRLMQIATDLFYGWGYNFYKAENQVRFDDLLVREKGCWLLGQCRDAVGVMLANFRRRHLPLPSREKPRPDPEALDNARVMQGVQDALGQLEGQIRTLPVPENDRFTRRFREELPTLSRLRDVDVQLIGRVKLLLDDLGGKDFAWLLANQATVQATLASLRETLRLRREILML